MTEPTSFTRRQLLASLAGVAAVSALPLKAQNPSHGIMTPVLTRGYSNTRDCVNTRETILTPANVKQRGMRQFFALPMEGDARGSEAQPLILPSVPMSDGVTHDVIITCSMNGTVWCYDANDSADLWMKKVGYPVNGGTNIDMYKINDHWSILSTPVADLDTFLLYLVAWISPDGTAKNGVYTVVVMDIRTGDILKKVPLTGLTYDPGHGLPVQHWDSSMRKQRSSLLLTNINGVKTVFFASGSVLETAQGASGWIIAFDTLTRGVTATLAMSSHWYGAGIWMAGQGLSSDAAGYLYGTTGNGGFDGVTDFAECIFQVQYKPPTATSKASLSVVNWWSPYSDAGRVGQNPTWPAPNQPLQNKLSGVSAPTAEAQKPVNAMKKMDMQHTVRHGKQLMFKPMANQDGAYADQDLGSGGVCLIPQYNMALFGGKDGVLYSAKMSNLGKTALHDFANPAANYSKLLTAPIWGTYFPGYNISPKPQDSSDLDFMFDGKTHHMHSTPAVAQIGNEVRAFVWGENGNLRAYRVNADGSLTYLGCSQEVASPNATAMGGGMPGGMLSLSISGNDTSTAILWATVPLGDANKQVVQGNLYAYDAWNIGKYADGSGALQLLWKSPNYTYNKFDPCVVSGGRVFVPTYADETLCFGLA